MNVESLYRRASNAVRSPKRRGLTFTSIETIDYHHHIGISTSIPPRNVATGARIVSGCAIGCFTFVTLALASFFLLLILLPGSCKEVHFQYGGPVAQRNSSARRVRKLRMAVILAKFRDKPAETRPPAYYEDYYTGTR